MIFSHFEDDSRHSLTLDRRFYKGGGGSAPAAAPVPQARAFAPVTEQLSDFSSLERDQKKKAAKRKGIGSTILAGETGQMLGGAVNSNFGQKTLLGA